MPIILVTGKNGHGKGQFIIREILQLQKENGKREKQGKPRRRIFTNIHGVNVFPNKPLIDCEPLPDNPLIFFGKQDDPNNPPPEGYFIPPVGSIFIFDEAQEFDWIKNKSGALSNDVRVRSLETHRHAGLDVYFLTQSPNYIHSHIQGLVSPHYYVERSMGLATSNVFKYGNYQKSPSSATTKKHADDHKIIKLGKKYGQYYKSSAEHNMKNSIPLKLKIVLAVFFACCAWTYYSFNKVDTNRQKDKQEREQFSKQVKNSQNNQSDNPLDSQNQNIQERLDELNKLKNETSIEQYNRRIYLIKNHLPNDYEVLKSEPALQVRGVIKKGNNCHAYNTYSDLMTLTLDECNYYINQTGRVHKSTSQGQIQSLGQIEQPPQTQEGNNL